MARLALICALASLALLGACARAVGAPADLDRSFGDRGIAPVVDPSTERVGLESAARMAIGPKDEIFVLYSDYDDCEPPSQECIIDLSLARFDAHGRLDASFGQGGAAHIAVHQNPYQHSFDLAVGQDRRPVVIADDLGPALIAKFDRAGRPDTSFGAGGRALWTTQTLAPSPPVVAVQKDGSVIVARERGSLSPGRSELAVARFTRAGVLDGGFGVAGESTVALSTRSRPAGLLLGPTGKINVATPQCCGGQPLFGEGFSVARLLANGAPDSGLDGDGTVLLPTPGAEATVEAAALAAGEAMVVIFEVEGTSSATVGNVVRLRADGQVDTSFGSSGTVRLFNRIGMTDPSGLTVDGQGRLVGVGWDGNVSLFRLRADGGADRTFNGGQHVSVSIKAAQEGAAAVGTQADGGIVALAESTCCQPKAYDLIRLRGGSSRIRCLGRRATIVGTRNADDLRGTPRRDVIAALGGRDKVRGLGGADLICGGPGKDSLGGGPGRDRVKQ